MKYFWMVAVCLLSSASGVYGQAGFICIYYAEWTFTQCDYEDTTPALVPVFVVHKGTPGATASQFMVTSGGGFNCTYVNEVQGPATIGSTQTGISISYGGCRASDILLVTINYYCQGTSPACSYLKVVPDPDAPTGTIVVVDCSFVKHSTLGGLLRFNADDSCDCLLDQPVPTKTTNWGKLKVLYQ